MSKASAREENLLSALGGLRNTLNAASRATSGGVSGAQLGIELRELIKALFVLDEPVAKPPVGYTVTVSWDQPQPKEVKR